MEQGSSPAPLAAALPEGDSQPAKRPEAEGSAPAAGEAGAENSEFRKGRPTKKQKWESSKQWLCPACGQTCIHLNTLDKHVQRCCMDLVQVIGVMRLDSPCPVALFWRQMASPFACSSAHSDP